MELCKPLIEYRGARNHLNPLLTTINMAQTLSSEPPPQHRTSTRQNSEGTPTMQNILQLFTVQTTKNY